MKTAATPHLPRHIAVIMDGNGRWGAARGLTRTAGHKAGLKAVRLVIEECSRRGVYPESVVVDGSRVSAWRGVPFVPPKFGISCSGSGDDQDLVKLNGIVPGRAAQPD